MKIIKPSVEILTDIDYPKMLSHIEAAYRVCYKSEDKICEGSAEKIIRSMALKRGHESPLEHESVSVKIVCDRGVTHEIVRHRIAAYSQESTRYCNYSGDKFGNEITVIEPCYWVPGTDAYIDWADGCLYSEEVYFNLLSDGATPQEARAVLPNSLKTELVMTADLREWRHFLRLRCDKAAHPQMREVAGMILEKFKSAMPVFFEDIDNG